LLEITDVNHLQEIFLANGWNEVTIVCLMVFMLFHWPCATTLLTIKKETASWRWVMWASLLPALLGVVLCIIINALCKFVNFSFL